MSEDQSGNRLPPPAFPPGARKRPSAAASPNGPSPESARTDGYISPDDPMPDRKDAVQDAFISPDEPIPDRDQELDDAFISPDEPIPHHDPVLPDMDGDEEGVVTGMDHDQHIEMEDLVAAGDPYVMDLMAKVGKLAEALNQKGEAGLRVTPGMDRFDATLRGYCVGYLAGRRAEDDDSPEY